MFKRILKTIIIITLCIAVLSSLLITAVNIYMTGKTKDHIITETEAADIEGFDCILILGAGVRTDGTPSLMLSDRLEVGCRLYENGVAEKILVSGDHGRQNYDEVNTMKQIAIDRGIPSEDIFMDHAGFNTYNSMYRARDVFLCKKILIVTQEFHLPRALYIAQKLGLEAYGVSASIRDYEGIALNEAREIAARTKDFFVTLFEADPICLGEAIPISGNGDLTNDKQFT